VIIEKPVAHVMEGANELIAALGERIGAVACPMRFYDYIVALKDEIEKGSFGTVYCGRQWYRQNMADWRPGTDYRESYSAMRSRGGGLFLDRIHEMDTARWLFGEPLRLRASWGKSDDLETDTEHVVHALSVHHQAIVTLDMDCLSPGYQCGIQVIGSARQVTCEFDPSMHRKAMEAQTRHWLQCLHGEVDPVQSVKEGYRVLNTALAAYASAGANSEWANFVPQTPPVAAAPPPSEPAPSVADLDPAPTPTVES
jgi:predicted dehydrogenase